MGELALAHPGQVLSDQRAYALACRDHVLKHHVVKMQGRAYVTVAGATQVASLMGFSCRECGCVFVHAQEGLAAHWLATVEVVDRDGQVIGRGSAICSTEERQWKNRDSFAQRSMAITRAAGKALRLCLGHVFAMLGDGVQATTAEEMPPEMAEPEQADEPALPHSLEAYILGVEACKGKKGTPYWRVKFRFQGMEHTLTAFKPVPQGERNSHLTLGVSKTGDQFIERVGPVIEGDG